jgi:superoxide reductase
MENDTMQELKELLQSADWKQEKHVPMIEMPNAVKKDEVMRLTVSVGKQVAHPNTTGHHIEWIEVYFHPDGEKFPVLLGRFDFAAHGAGAQGVDTSTIYTAPEVSVAFKTGKPGRVMAMSYCNIHGLWTGTADLKF